VQHLRLLIAASVVSFLGVSPALAAPSSDPSGTGSAGSLLLSLINQVGDDTFSTTNVAPLLDPTTTSTQHFGPYASNSPDSSTCGNDWATDTFNRDFTVKHNPDGTFTVVEQFKDGSFVTMAGFSPGGCDTDPGGMIGGGKTGGMHGYFIIPLPTGEMQTSTSPYCDAQAMTNNPCTTERFINTHFTPACYPGCGVTTYFFHYSAGDQMLLFHEWKNASCDRGGNSGDIASSGTALQKSPRCT